MITSPSAEPLVPWPIMWTAIVCVGLAAATVDALKFDGFKRLKVGLLTVFLLSPLVIVVQDWEDHLYIEDHYAASWGFVGYLFNLAIALLAYLSGRIVIGLALRCLRVWR